MPIEETITVLADYVKASKVGGIGLSECGAPTIRKAHAGHPILAIEIDLSLFTTDVLTDGVITTCKMLGTPIIVYSPLSCGILTRQFKTTDDLPEKDQRRMVPRSQPEAFDHNMGPMDEISKSSERKVSTLPQTATRWAYDFSKRVGWIQFCRYHALRRWRG